MGTVPVPHPFTAGDDATSAVMQTLTDSLSWLLGSATSGGSKRPLFKGRQTTAQAAIANATDTAILLDVEDVDYDSGHSTATNTSRYTAQTALWYLLFGQIPWATNATGVRQAKFRTNGTTEVPGIFGQQIAATASYPAFCVAVGFVFLNVSDYVELMGFQDSTGTLAPSASATAGRTPSMSVWGLNL